MCDREKDILPFNLRQLPTGATLVLIGKRNSGKTTTILNILHHFQHVFEFGYIFCGSTASEMAYKRHMPTSFVHNRVDTSTLKGIIQFQEKRAANGTIKPIFLCFDDLNYNQKLLRSEDFFRVFANGRHYKIFFILSLQYAMGIGPNCRGNIDALILHKETVVQNQKKLFDGYVCGFDTFDHFRSAFTQVAQNRRVLVCMKSEEQINDFPIYHWRPTYPVPNFTMNERGSWWNHAHSLPLHRSIGVPIKHNHPHSANLNPSVMASSSSSLSHSYRIVGDKKLKSSYVAMQEPRRTMQNNNGRVSESAAEREKRKRMLVKRMTSVLNNVRGAAGSGGSSLNTTNTSKSNNTNVTRRHNNYVLRMTPPRSRSTSMRITTTSRRPTNQDHQPKAMNNDGHNDVHLGKMYRHDLISDLLR